MFALIDYRLFREAYQMYFIIPLQLLFMAIIYLFEAEIVSYRLQGQPEMFYVFFGKLSNTPIKKD